MTFQPKNYPGQDNKDFELDCEHYIQINNTGGTGYRECNGTAHSTLVQYLTGKLDPAYKSKGYREPEDVYFSVLAKYGDTTDHAAHTKALREFGIESYFSYNTDINELAYVVREGYPVVIGNKYKKSGHMVTAYGMCEHGFRILCPNGIRAGSASWWHERFHQNSQAKSDVFSFSLMKKIFTVNGPSDGWARIVTSVNGEKTSLHPDILGKTI